MVPTLYDISFERKRVLLRAEFNVPMKKGIISDDRRIVATIPTIKNLLLNGSSQIVIIAHLGRPGGRSNPDLSLKPVAERLEKLLEEDVVFIDDCIDVSIPKDAKIVLLENLRFHPEEKANDEEFAKKLAVHGDVYVNEAFGMLHRVHASVVALPKLFAVNERAVGFLVQKELMNLDFSNPERPFVSILGCAKIGDKIELVESLLDKVDKLLLGGAIAFNFLKAMGLEVGKSLYEPDKVELAKRLLERYGNKIILPKDIVISEDIEDGSEIFTVAIDKIPVNMKGLDIGDESVEEFKRVLSTAKTVFWNGPVGVFEVPPFDTATRDLAEYLTKLKSRVVVGGGDTTSAVDNMGFSTLYTHVSSGGGATLQLVAGKTLPGLDVFENLSDKK